MRRRLEGILLLTPRAGLLWSCNVSREGGRKIPDQPLARIRVWAIRARAAAWAISIWGGAVAVYTRLCVMQGSPLYSASGVAGPVVEGGVQRGLAAAAAAATEGNGDGELRIHVEGLTSNVFAHRLFPRRDTGIILSTPAVPCAHQVRREVQPRVGRGRAL
jgi:hypothetical protein